MMGNGVPRVERAFDNPATAARSKGDIFGVIINAATSIWKFNQQSQAVQGVRRALNDAVYGLNKRPEGFFVLVHMAARDISVGSQRGMIQFVSASASFPQPVNTYFPPTWISPPGTIIFDQVIHNVQGVCPRNLPSNAMNLEQARAMLSRMR
jgi:hypothetical protein